MENINITPKELHAKIQNGSKVALIDVREPQEVAICSLPGAKHIPLGEFTARTNEISKNFETVVYCKVGGRSGDAVRYLVGLGYTNVKNLEGGILRWADEIDSSIQKY